MWTTEAENSSANRERLVSEHVERLVASALYAGGRLTEAVAALQRALADSEHYLGPGHPMTKTVRDNLDAAMQTLA